LTIDTKTVPFVGVQVVESSPEVNQSVFTIRLTADTMEDLEKALDQLRDQL
jgi:hypothetical protein